MPTIPAEECPEIRVLEELPKAVEAGLLSLREAADEESLVEFYAVLLTGHKPAVLASVQAPLQPEALAALLLPLPRSLADRLSLAGWIMSRTWDPGEMAAAWDVVVYRSLPVQFEAKPNPRFREKATTMARALLEGKPPTQGVPADQSLAAGIARDLRDPDRFRPAVRRIAEFAVSPDRGRHLPTVEEKISLTREERELLRLCFEHLRAEVNADLDLPEKIQKARRQHLLRKAQILGEAVRSLDPDASDLDFRF